MFVLIGSMLSCFRNFINKLQFVVIVVINPTIINAVCIYNIHYIISILSILLFLELSCLSFHETETWFVFMYLFGAYFLV